MAEVVLQHVSKIYSDAHQRKEKKKAVDNISLQIKDKEFMVLVGPSGCGKSTLLRMIAGLEEISEGILTIDGKVMNNVAASERDIAMVFQNYALYPHMTVFDNMAFGLKMKKVGREEIRKRVVETARLLEIEDELNRKPKTLSGGQRQRVAIGRAIIRRPKVFLFDEPLSNLDAKLRSQMRIELQKLHHEIDATMIYVTHDQTEAMTLGDRIAVMNKGKLMQTDRPMSLYHHPANQFVAGFIGSPTMNFLKGYLRKDDAYYFDPEAGVCQIRLGNVISADLSAYVDHQIFIGIRPEDITLTDISAGRSDCRLTVTAYENMGNEQLIYFTLENQTIIVRSQQVQKIEIGSDAGVLFSRDKLHFMEAAEGKVICSSHANEITSLA